MHRRVAFRFWLLCLALGTAQAAGGPPRIDHYGDPLPDGAVFRIGTTRLRHRIMSVPPFHNVLISPDGKFAFSSGGFEPEICMWETATGREVRRFHTKDPYIDICISADGALLAVRNGDEISLYNIASGKKIRILDSSELSSDFLSFSPDGKILTAFRSLATSSKYWIQRWETATGKDIDNWELGVNRPLALSSASRLVASIEMKDDSQAAANNKEDMICLWDMATHKKVRQWKVAGRVPRRSRCLIFSPDGRSLVTAGEDAMIRVHEAATGKEVRSWNGGTGSEATAEPAHVAVGWLAFTPDGKTLASVDRNCVLRFWDWKTGRERRHFDGVSGPISFSADGRILAAGGNDSRVRLWDAATGRDLCPFADPGGIIGIDFSPDGRLLAAGTDRPLLHVLEPSSGRPIKEYPNCRLVTFSPDGAKLLVRNRDRLLALLDAATGEEHIRFPGTEKAFFGGWDAEKHLLLTTSHYSVRIWDTETGKMRREIRGYKKTRERFRDLHHCSPDGRTIAVTDRKAGLIHLFATDTGKELRQLTGYSAAVRYSYKQDRATHTSFTGGFWPIYSPDGEFILAACDESSFGLWEVASGKRTLRWNCADLLPISPTFSPDGNWLALLDTHLALCLVDAATGRVRHRLNREKFDRLWTFDSATRAFSADGRLFAVAYDSHKLVLWETATGRLIRTWPSHGRGALMQIIFAPDGRRLATVGRDGTALVWDVAGLSPDGQLPNRKLTPAETKQAWKDLADTDAAKAHRAVWSLVADPMRALPLLREHLHPAPAVNPHRLARWIADLDSNEYAVRETATRELRKMGELAQPALRTAIKGKPSLELRRRVQGLLDEMDSAVLSAENLRDLRAVAVLEHIASADARQLLRVLAEGGAGARLTEDAKASLARLHSRRIQP